MIVDTGQFQALSFEVEALREGSSRFCHLTAEVKRLAASCRRLLRTAGCAPASAAEGLQALHQRLDALTAVLSARAVDQGTLDAVALTAYRAGVADGEKQAAGRLRGGRHARPRSGRTAQLRLVEGGLR